MIVHEALGIEVLLLHLTLYSKAKLFYEATFFVITFPYLR